jgi:hypothetical protein
VLGTYHQHIVILSDRNGYRVLFSPGSGAKDLCIPPLPDEYFAEISILFARGARS